VKVDKQIAVIGVSDEETAHLRLLMRKAADELDHRWRWGSETGADLVIVDPSSFAGQMARTRVQAAGVRCAVFSDEAMPGTELVLRRPLRLVNVVTVLNKAAGATARPTDIEPDKHDFYVRDVGDADALHDMTLLEDIEPRSAPAADAAPGLEDLLRIEPIDIKTDARVEIKLGEDTVVLGTSGPTARSEARGANVPEVFSRSSTPAAADSAGSRRGLADTARHSLRVYLDGDLLGGPARITLPDAPALVLDPKQKLFHSSGRLATLEPYCRTALRLCDWQTLTTAELNELRVAEPPQPYMRLLWLYVLVHSEGQLARNLDPGGTYRLTRWIEIERDFSSYFRIASTMLQPARLHEIAAASGASMADVFDVVNAYDAIGLLECQRRPPRGGEVAPEPPPSLLKRLRNPFRKS